MIPIILATGLIGIILLVLGFKLDEKHQVLKVLSIFFAVYCVVLLGKFGMDSKNVCVPLLTSTVLTGNTTTYTYTNTCNNVTSSPSSLTLYKTSLWYFRIVFIYVFGFLIWLVGTYLLKLNSMRKAP